MESQGIEVIPLTMVTPFFQGKKAWEVGMKNEIKPVFIDIFEEFLPILRAPKYGYGSQVNPCVDCHILMLKIAKAKMEELGADFVLTGEVLGQRPMSQNRSALELIERESGLKGLLLRPLSAKLLPPTKAEMEGVVRRELLLGISGRARRPQMELVKAYNITHYETPGGGCLLTDPLYALKVKDLLVHSNSLERWDFELLKFGRHFRITKDLKLVVGRDKGENEALMGFIPHCVAHIKTLNTPGPLGLLFGSIVDSALETSLRILASYSDPAPDHVFLVEVIFNDENYTKETLKVSFPQSKKDFRNLLITAQGH